MNIETLKNEHPAWAWTPTAYGYAGRRGIARMEVTPCGGLWRAQWTMAHAYALGMAETPERAVTRALRNAGVA